jgi:hypothetical protein
MKVRGRPAQAFARSWRRNRWLCGVLRLENGLLLLAGQDCPAEIVFVSGLSRKTIQPYVSKIRRNSQRWLLAN